VETETVGVHRWSECLVRRRTSAAGAASHAGQA